MHGIIDTAIIFLGSIFLTVYAQNDLVSAASIC